MKANYRQSSVFFLLRHRNQGVRSLRTFSKVTADDLRVFETIVGPTRVSTDREDVGRASTDWLKHYKGNASAVLRPSSTAEVSQILRYCNERKIAVVPQGGNTGLVGGSVPIDDEVVLSLERMNKVISFDASSGALVAEAGCILEALDHHISPQWMMPLDLGAKGSCHIGGNVSTNAGGLRYLRYGSLHGSVLGLQAVLADGSVIDSLSVLRKDNVGYDVKQLFIGSEGTLGVVTAVGIQTVPRPVAVNVGMFACPAFKSCIELLSSARRHLGEVLSAAEMIDHQSMITMNGVLNNASDNPLGASPFYVLLETQGSNFGHDTEKLQALLEAVTSAGTVTNGVVAQDDKQAKALWKLREHVPVSINQRGHVFKYDLSLSPKDMYAIVEACRRRLARWSDRGVAVVGYGHLGDANIHLNISTPDRGQAYHDELQAQLEPWVYEWTLRHGGSISAEHGLGQSKAAWLPAAKPPAVVGLMRALKAAMDPHGILNPGKVLPAAP